MCVCVCVRVGGGIHNLLGYATIDEFGEVELCKCDEASNSEVMGKLKEAKRVTLIHVTMVADLYF